MHLRFVELFCDVAQLRSFSKAATIHDVSQSAASQAVHALENRLGIKLIDRSKRPLELTPAGEVYYNGCRDLLQAYRQIEDRIQRLKDRVTGVVRVAAIYSVGVLQMDLFEARFHQLFPEAKVKVEYAHPDEVCRRVAEDEAELGLISFPRQRGDLTFVRWQEQPMVAVVAPQHPWARRRTVSVRELQGVDFVGFTPELTIRKEMQRWLKAQGVDVNVVHEFDNIENIKQAVEVSSAVAVLPAPTVRREVDRGMLASLEFSDATWFRPLGIVHRRSRPLSIAAQRFIELLHADPSTFPRARPGAATPAAETNAADVARHRVAPAPPRRKPGVRVPTPT